MRLKAHGVCAKAILSFALVGAVLAWLFLTPEPHLRDSFGLVSPPPSQYTNAVASMAVEFPSVLRHLVTVESVGFTDSSGQYAQEDAWVNLGPGGGVLWDVGALEEWSHTDPEGYRISDPHLSFVFLLRIAHTADDFASSSGNYRVTLHLRFMGRSYSRDVEWANPR